MPERGRRRAAPFHFGGARARHAISFPLSPESDHSYLEEALARLPRGRYRAIGIMDDTVTDAELARLHAAGMRGMRFNFVRMFKMAPSPRLLQSSIDRIRQYGWYIKIFVGPEELPDAIETLRAITAVPVVIDHMARLNPAEGRAQGGPRPGAGPAAAGELLGVAVERRAHVGADGRMT